MKRRTFLGTTVAILAAVGIPVQTTAGRPAQAKQPEQSHHWEYVLSDQDGMVIAVLPARVSRPKHLSATTYFKTDVSVWKIALRVPASLGIGPHEIPCPGLYYPINVARGDSLSIEQDIEIS